MTYYPDFSWNGALSTISDPQSPHSSSESTLGMNRITSPAFCQEEILPVDEYPAPNQLLDIDSNLLPKHNALDHLSPYTDFDAWSGSQSDRNISPEQWSPLLPKDAALPQPDRRSKRPVEASRGVRKERKPTSVPSRRRRGTGTNDMRTFVCSFAPYGCESTFVSKNEWKRHVTSQHLQLGFYRCDVGKCNSQHQTHFLSISTLPATVSTLTSTSKSNAKATSSISSPPPGQSNDFNRKDLFTQHHRRMHAPWLQSGRREPTGSEQSDFEAGLEEVRQRCWHGLRTPPLQSHCGFCREGFSGEGSWDVRMEHIGRHFEREDRRALGVEREDLALREWGLEQGILVLVDGVCRLASLI
ncbi:hypothetical protein N7520_005394 [Penicillium odoratum]|uniref:uncharacterized protein n=1 Tax=Penicillium odoratum TaxID=1167516 RepID=UPI0025471870|nr:uncharacterized protein N7520_005394 [Penicillium odoratum]KAJ5765835.1 hypothetical protein N7520_005394 [Penicillium odoratum]